MIDFTHDNNSAGQSNLENNSKQLRFGIRKSKIVFIIVFFSNLLMAQEYFNYGWLAGCKTWFYLFIVILQIFVN